jgi:hypothetical protein
MICPDSEDIKSTITGPGDNIRINTARPRDLFKRAYRFHPSQITGTSVEEDTVTLTLASDAQPLFYEWAKMIEGISSDDTKSKPFTEHLMKYPTLLSRLTLNLHMIETLDKPDERDFSGTVSKETLDLAIKWCEVLESHAKRVYGIYEQSIGAAAKTLLDRIKSNHIVDGMSFRQIQRKNLRGLSSIEDIEAACQELCDVNAVAVDESMIGRRGKTRSLKLRVNPEILTS